MVCDAIATIQVRVEVDVPLDLLKAVLEEEGYYADVYSDGSMYTSIGEVYKNDDGTLTIDRDETYWVKEKWDEVLSKAQSLYIMMAMQKLGKIHGVKDVDGGKVFRFTVKS